MSVSHADCSSWSYRLSGVRYDYGNGSVLEIDELVIPRGQSTCLLGPTGAGKSTLVRLLARSIEPSSGRVEMAGDAVGSDRRPSVAMVYQHPIPLRRTVFENIAYGLRVRSESRQDIQVSVDRWLEVLQLTDLAGQRADRLSGGQWTLVALARALVTEPDVLLLDEPTANLDPARVQLVERVVAEEQRRRRCTVVWSTHHLFQARRVADHVVLLWEGKCIEEAETKTFFESPSDPRTRAFLDGKLVF